MTSLTLPPLLPKPTLQQQLALPHTHTHTHWWVQILLYHVVETPLFADQLKSYKPLVTAMGDKLTVSMMCMGIAIPHLPPNTPQSHSCNASGGKSPH